MLALSWNDKDDNQVALLSIRDGKKRILGAGMGGGCVGFSNDGMLLAFGEEDTSGEVSVWRIADGQSSGGAETSGEGTFPETASRA
jgi:hypothetical protein